MTLWGGVASVAKTKRSASATEDTAWIERVLSLADERGIVYRRLTEAAGVEPQRIDKWRRGSAPSLRHLVGIASYLDVSIDWIATGRTAGPSEGVGFPRETISDEERHLLWAIKSLGVTPAEAVARIASVGKPMEFVAEQRLGDADRDPADPEIDDSPGRGKQARVDRR